MGKVAHDLANKTIFGAVFMGLIAVFATIMKAIGITVSGNISDLGSAITKMSIGQGIGWVISIVIFAGVAIFMTKYRHSLMIVGRNEHTESVHLPPQIKWYGYLGVGILVSISLWALQYLASTMGGTIGLSQLWTSIMAGSILGVIGALVSYLAIGYIVEGIASQLTKIQTDIQKSGVGSKFIH